MNGFSNHALLGVGGSIAAYRTPDLAAQLRHSGFEVRTILSRAAEQFVTKTSIASMSRGEVFTAADGLTDVWHPTHIELADWADIALIAPATAVTIGRLACGIAEGLLAETFLALRPEVHKFIAPAMNGNMLHQPAVQRNLNQLQEDGFTIIAPRVGELACGYEGDGKIAQISDIISEITRS
ncbi:MAG: flavoprotein [Candidatus Saccharimonadales bacterium]